MKIPNYIREIKELKKSNFDSFTNEDLLSIAKEVSEKDFREYIKNNKDEEIIKKAGVEYFITIYILIKSNQYNIPDGFKSKLKNIIIKNNNIDDKIQNLEFYLGSCGISSQNLALN